jgi:hypothetical protein
MPQRPTPRRLRPQLVGALFLAACAGGGAPTAEPTEPGVETGRPVLESVRPSRPDDRAANARREWVADQVAARRGTAAPPPAPAGEGGSSQRGSPGKVLIFSSVTGHVPVGDVQRATPRTPEEQENLRVAELERALEAERAREERPRDAGSDQPAGGPAPGSPADVLSAPAAPELPELDPSRLVSEKSSVPAGSWGNAEDLPVIRRSLDADGNGRPEEVRYFDVEASQLLRREEDRDLDGNSDTWSRYERDALVERVLDTNADGRPDEWETYQNGRLLSREVDADHDGQRDDLYRYRYDVLAELRRDSDGDGKVDRVEIFERRRRVQVIEDANRDERMDTWTSFEQVQGAEVVARIERDTRGRGKPDVFETYRPAPGPPVLVKREEDVDGDGTIDVTQQFEPDGTPARPQASPL